MKEVPLAKGLYGFDAVQAANQLYDSLTKSTSNVSPSTYAFVHKMVDKATDGEEFTHAEVDRLYSLHLSKFS